MPVIKAAVCHDFAKPLVVQNVTLKDPGPGEVMVDLGACAICFSDISYLDGGWGGTLPAVYGHEAAGKVSAVGPGVTRYAVGDTVLATLIRSCGHCAPCSGGKLVLCGSPYDRATGPLAMPDGSTLEHGMAVGGFAEKVVVDQSQLAAIPADMPMDAASLLSCGVITGIGAAVNAAAVRPGHVVVVIGAGGVGLNAIQGARIAGASRIIAIDMTEDKLAIAREFGATDGILASSEKPWRQAREIAGRGADAVLVTVGAVRAYDDAPKYLAAGGRLVMVGMPHSGQASSYEPVNIAALGQVMIGSKMGDVVLARDIPWMVDLYQQKRLKLDELISGRWKLEEINEAIASTRAGAARRNVIVF